MRDRRNTNLSVSSTDSTASSNNSGSSSEKTSLHQKRYTSRPPSASLLPPPVTKENRSRRSSTRVMAAKGLAVVVTLLMLMKWMLGGCTLLHKHSLSMSEYAIDTKTELVAESDLPDEPTAVMVQAPDGSSKWTISIPQSYDFPLDERHYKEMCANGAGLRSTISPNSKHHGHRHWWRKSQYYIPDHTYFDIAEAEQAGLLPKWRHEQSDNVCDSSITFVLDSDDASFGTSLLQLWLTYGLAKKENRAFFIDDSRWAWGNYTSYFLPPPSPSCARPPPHRIVPFPSSARHLVVSSSTAPWIFGPDFHAEFQNSRKYSFAAQSKIYDLIRTGYLDLFHLTPEDANYAAQRILDLKLSDTPLIGLQIRRGDAHPLEYQYRKDYLPLERYTLAAQTLSETTDPAPIYLLASDDPEIFNSADLTLPKESLQRVQTRILLASKSSLPQAAPVHLDDNAAYTKPVAENVGWEGGFYPGLFFGLSEGVKEFVGRAFLMDLAVLGEADRVVCGVGSASCRLLGVMGARDGGLGTAGRWVNVDDGRGWSWDGRGR